MAHLQLSASIPKWPKKYARLHGFLGNEVMTAALIQKLTQNAVILNMNGGPYGQGKD